MGRFTVEVTASGPQASAAARSFVTKYFERNLFQIPTGDKDDADQQAAEPLPETKGPAKAKGAAKAKKAAIDDDKKKKIDAFVKEIEVFLATSPDGDALVEWEAKNAAKLGWLRKNYHEAEAVLAMIESKYEAAKVRDVTVVPTR